MSDAATRRSLSVRLGDTLVNAGRGAEAAAAFLEAVDGAPAADALELQRRAADQYLISGHIAEGVSTLRAVLFQVGLRMAYSPRTALVSIDPAADAPRAARDRLPRERLDPDSLREADAHRRLLVGRKRTHALGPDPGQRFSGPPRAARPPGGRAVPGGSSADLRSRCLRGGRRTKPRPDGAPSRSGRRHRSTPRQLPCHRVRTIGGGRRGMPGGPMEGREGLHGSAPTSCCASVAGASPGSSTTPITTRCSRCVIWASSSTCGEVLPARARGGPGRGAISTSPPASARAFPYVLGLARDQAPQARAELREAIASWPGEPFTLQHWYETMGQVECLSLRRRRGRRLAAPGRALASARAIPHPSEPIGPRPRPLPPGPGGDRRGRQRRGSRASRSRRKGRTPHRAGAHALGVGAGALAARRSRLGEAPGRGRRAAARGGRKRPARRGNVPLTPPSPPAGAARSWRDARATASSKRRIAG